MNKKYLLLVSLKFLLSMMLQIVSKMWPHAQDSFKKFQECLIKLKKKNLKKQRKKLKSKLYKIKNLKKIQIVMIMILKIQAQKMKTNKTVSTTIMIKRKVFQKKTLKV